jgi:hypothetical protein
MEVSGQIHDLVALSLDKSPFSMDYIRGSVHPRAGIHAYRIYIAFALQRIEPRFLSHISRSLVSQL